MNQEQFREHCIKNLGLTAAQADELWSTVVSPAAAEKKQQDLAVAEQANIALQAKETHRRMLEAGADRLIADGTLAREKREEFIQFMDSTIGSGGAAQFSADSLNDVLAKFLLGFYSNHGPEKIVHVPSSFAAPGVAGAEARRAALFDSNQQLRENMASHGFGRADYIKHGPDVPLNTLRSLGGAAYASQFAAQDPEFAAQFAASDPLLAAANEANLEDRRIKGMCHVLGISRETFDKNPVMWRNHAKNNVPREAYAQFAAESSGEPFLAAADSADMEDRRIKGLCHKLGISRETFDKSPGTWRGMAEKFGHTKPAAGAQFAAGDPLLAAADEADMEDTRIMGICHKLGIGRETFDKNPEFWRGHANRVGA